MEKQFKKGIAYDYGIKAFKRGLKAIPCMDNNFLSDVISGCKVGESIPYLEEWLQGWTDANLKSK